ncbi:hypothetical protein BOTNAR_0403g00100 [Botryotinia narcissicola]|uniref:Uncharacterized protein n=1 Tax=Botryotinia narcissicola TaxID=278944 RepID=A0A4Z1HZY7_9HELO|nr:hypothetical protein BOTNAR_0403g00100 [Botryotinia narcissicola]
MDGTFSPNGSMLNQRNVPTRVGTPPLLHAALPSENIIAEFAKVAVQEHQDFNPQVISTDAGRRQGRQISILKL